MTAFLDYTFRDEGLLKRALTHRSAASKNNERLEFLGDALIGFIVADFLFAQFPTADEGQLTRLRASLVNRETLASIARSIDLGKRLYLGEGELKSGGWRRDSILANTLEAVIGAIYLDGGIEACRRQLARWYEEHFTRIDPDTAIKDPKTELQEFLQGRHLPLPVYRTVEINGPAHDQIFRVECVVESLSPIIAEGKSRRSGEQEAAKMVLEMLRATHGR